MATAKAKPPSWSDVKVHLAALDRSALLNLVQEMFAASKENKLFLQTRFFLGDDVLLPYKQTIERWVCPNVLGHQDYAVAKAKKAITDYKKAAGRPEGLAELAVFYCERAAVFFGTGLIGRRRVLRSARADV